MSSSGGRSPARRGCGAHAPQVWSAWNSATAAAYPPDSRRPAAPAWRPRALANRPRLVLARPTRNRDRKHHARDAARADPRQWCRDRRGAAAREPRREVLAACREPKGFRAVEPRTIAATAQMKPQGQPPSSKKPQVSFHQIEPGRKLCLECVGGLGFELPLRAMTLPLFIYVALRQHALSTAVTGRASRSRADWLMCGVDGEDAVAVARPRRRRRGFDACSRRRVSKLQLVLNGDFPPRGVRGQSALQRLQHSPASMNQTAIRSRSVTTSRGSGWSARCRTFHAVNTRRKEICCVRGRVAFGAAPDVKEGDRRLVRRAAARAQGRRHVQSRFTARIDAKAEQCGPFTITAYRRGQHAGRSRGVDSLARSADDERARSEARRRMSARWLLASVRTPMAGLAARHEGSTSRQPDDVRVSGGVAIHRRALREKIAWSNRC